MNNNNGLNKIGISFVITLSASTYALGLEYNSLNINNTISIPIPIHIDENLFPKQISSSIKLLDSKIDAKEVSSDDDDYYSYEEDVVEIPVAKKMRFKFGKPEVKVFEI